MTRLALVAAVAENGVIGAGGRLPWRISDDLKWFKKVTLGKPVIMGRKTFESIGRPLPGRDNIVVTRRPGWTSPGILVAATIDEALRLGRRLAVQSGAAEVCVIGGGELYRETVGAADRIYLTRVKAAVAGDARFPEIELSGWRAVLVGGAVAGEANDYSCDFFILDRAEIGTPAGSPPS